MRTTLIKKIATGVVALGLGATGAIGLAEPLPVGAESPLLPPVERGPAGVDGEITRLYVALLDRQPESDGLEYWVDRRRAGMPLTDMVAFFRTSPEFQQTFGTQLNASTEQWVEFMYVEVLERPSEQAGKDFWVELVESGGATNEDLIVFFADSTEFRVKTGTGLEGLMALVDSSEAQYASEPNYRYERSTASLVGNWRTTIVVSDGAVSERSYSYSSHSDPSTDVAWTETGADVGTHDDGAPALTILELHDACREHLMSLDRIEHHLLVEVDGSGRMTLCGGEYRTLIADAADGDYIRIENFVSP